MKSYRERITALAPNVDPAQVEAWMRLEHGTLDQLTARQFADEVRWAAECVVAAPEDSIELARSYGYLPKAAP